MKRKNLTFRPGIFKNRVQTRVRAMVRRKRLKYTRQAFLHWCSRPLTLIRSPLEIADIFGVIPFSPKPYSDFPVRCTLAPPVLSRNVGEPKSLCPGNIPWKWDERAYPEELMGYVVELENGIALTNGINLDQFGNTVMGASHRYKSFARKRKSSFQKHLMNHGPLAQPAWSSDLGIESYRGVVTVLCNSYGNLFTHFLFESIGRLALIENEFDKTSRIFVRTAAPYQQRYLTLLGVQSEQIIPANSPETFGITADKLIIPCYQPSDPFIPAEKIVEYLRRKLIPAARIDLGQGKKIFISRRFARYRRITNEDQLIPILDRHGFKTVLLENMTVDEQISTFKYAHIIVAPHGAGLGNLIYCDPGTRLLEIFSSLNRTLFFGFSVLLEIDYRYLSGVGGDRLLNKNKRDITVDPADFEKQLELLCN